MKDLSRRLFALAEKTLMKDGKRYYTFCKRQSVPLTHARQRDCLVRTGLVETSDTNRISDPLSGDMRPGQHGRGTWSPLRPAGFGHNARRFWLWVWRAWRQFWKSGAMNGYDALTAF